MLHSEVASRIAALRTQVGGSAAATWPPEQNMQTELQSLRTALGGTRTTTWPPTRHLHIREELEALEALASTSALVPELPWAMPTRTTMAASDKKVVAYFHTFPLWDSGSYDSWLNPASSTAYGGRWRQRPYPFRTASTDAARRTVALEDIAMAANIGIDVFTINILPDALYGTAPNTMDTRILPYYDAAATYSTQNTPGFKMNPNISMLQVKGLTGSEQAATSYADKMAPLLTHAAAHKIGTRPVVQFYNLDDMTDVWYTTFFDRLLNSHSINAIGIPSHQSNTTTALAGYSTLFGNGRFTAIHQWNTPTYPTTPDVAYDTFRNWAATNGVDFMCAAGPRWENDRPEDLKEIEGKGLTVIQNSWLSAIQHDDPMMHIVSWSDHLESHNIRPSTGYQWVPYDITAYYLAWYKTGTAPTITRDALYYAHRMHKYRKADGTTLERDASVMTGGAYTMSVSDPLDQVIVTAFLTAGADVIIRTGGVDRTTTINTSGVHTITAPMFANDTATFRIRRGGADVIPTLSSAFPTRQNITYQDLLYRMGSSTRAAITGVQSTLPQDR